MSKISNTTRRLVISLFSAYRQRVLPFLEPRAYDSLTDKGMATQYLYVVNFNWAFITEIILSLFWRVYETHHSNAGSLEIPRTVQNYVNSIVLDYFIIERGIHCSLPSFQEISKFYPTVDFHIRCWPDLVIIHWSTFWMAVESLEKLSIPERMECETPSE